MPSLESAISGHHPSLKDIPTPNSMTPITWGSQNTGPGAEAKLRKSEGKTTLQATGEYPHGICI